MPHYREAFCVVHILTHKAKSGTLKTGRYITKTNTIKIMYINEVTVCGRLTRDPELKALPSGMQVINFGVATNRTWKDKDTQEKKEEVEFHNVVAFGKTAETIAQYFHKGDEIYVRGRLKTSSWEVEGGKRYKTEIMLERFEFGQKRKDDQGQSGYGSYTSTAPATQPSGAPAYPEEEINPDDIPF